MLKVLKKYKAAIIMLLIADLIFLVPLTVRIDYSMTTPGGLNEVTDVIEINNDFEFKGSFNTTFVLSVNKITMFQYLVGLHNDQFDIYQNTTNVTTKEDILSGKITHNASIEYAIINAYQEANKKDPSITLEYEVSGIIIYYRSNTAKTLAIGDLIYEIDGYTKIEMIDYLNNLNSTSQPTTKTLNIKFYDYNDDNKSKETQILLSELNNHYSKYRKHKIISSNPKFTTNHTNVGGPSGGLLNTLNVYSNLIEIDMTKGYKIAGTGTININGKVGAIGGMEQKIYTAQKNKVDYFFVPYSDNKSSVEYSNYLESMNAYKKIKNPTFEIIPVRSFQEAISFLEGLK